jgi:negative regulator of flagellin synthesis FlgM
MDSIGIKTGSIARIAPSAPVQAAKAATEPAVQTSSAIDTASVASAALTKSMATSPPVNTERVAEIKKAIATGKFPLLPSTIADRLIALKLEWNSNAKA